MKRNAHVGGQQMPLWTPDSDWKRPAELPDLRHCKVIALDRETRDDGLAQKRGPGWVYGAGFVAGVSVAWEQDGETKAFYAPVQHYDSDCFDYDVVRRWEIDHQKAGVSFVMHNALYDIGWGARMNVPVPQNIHDTACMAYLIDETMPEFNLDALCKWRGIPGKDETLLRDAAGCYGINPKNELWRLPAKFVGAYAEADAVATLKLMRSLEQEIKAQSLQEPYQLEMDLIPLIYEMRTRGIRVDLEAAYAAKDTCMQISQQAFQDLSDKLKTTVSIDEARKNDWLHKVFEHHKIPFPRDKDGRGSFEAKWMKEVNHWLPQLLVRAKSYREAADKFIQTYVIDYAEFANGRLHANINQFRGEDGGTRTSRFSYSEPPLQQMPHRSEKLTELIRGLFLPEDGALWQRCDYSQQEYRLIVHYAARQKLPKAHDAAEKYRTDPATDFHSMVAEMTGLARKPAKDVNFAKSYGAGVKKFASMINKSEDEARSIMEQYDRELPFVKQLNERCSNKAERTGFIKLLDGARIHFNHWVAAWREHGVEWTKENNMSDCHKFEADRRVNDPSHAWHGKALRRSRCNKALNALIQGGAARQTKMAMRALWQEKLVPLLQMHDELDFSVTNEKDATRASEIMRDVVKLEVPMMVDTGFGKTWGDAVHAWKDVS